jgi:hypothetical protein
LSPLRGIGYVLDLSIRLTTVDNYVDSTCARRLAVIDRRGFKQSQTMAV